MSVSRPDRSQRVWGAVCRGEQESGRQGAEIEASVETVGECAEVSGAILAEGEGMVAAGKAGFEVAEHGVDPLEFRQVLRLAPADDGGLMSAACIGNGAEAGESIGEHRASGGEVVLGPLSDRFEGEPGDQRQLGARGMPVVGQRDGDHEGHFVLGATSGLAAAALAAQVGIIDLDRPLQHMAVFPFGHRLHQFVMDQPCGRVTHSQLSLQCQRRQPGLGLADEVNREEPGAQPELRAVTHGAGDERRLMPAGIALQQLVRTTWQNTMPRSVAPRTPKPCRPPRLLKRRSALRVRPKATAELRHRHAGLKLNSIHGHRAALRNDMEYSVGPGGSPCELGARSLLITFFYLQRL